jgi:integrase
MRLKLTNRNALALKAPKKGDRYYRDTEIKGLALRVGASGQRAWVLEYTIPKRKLPSTGDARADGKNPQRRYVIGRLSEYTVETARDEATELRRKVSKLGQDPRAAEKAEQAERESKAAADKRALTFTQLYDLWHTAKGEERKSAANDRSSRKKFTSLENVRARDVTAGQIEAILTGLKDTPIAANRALALIKTVFRFGVRKHHLESDPTKDIERPHDEAYRIVPPPSATELIEFKRALAAHPDQEGANAIRLVFWTGSRLREVLWAKWSAFDLERSEFYKHDTKTGPVIIPINRLAHGLLCEMKRTAASDKWVFPSRARKDRPRWDVDNVWHPVRDALIALNINRDGMHLHDLRHWYAALLRSKGMKVQDIAPLLGHKTSAITERYAPLQVDTLRNEMEQVVLAIEPPAPKQIAPPASKRGRKAVAR